MVREDKQPIWTKPFISVFLTNLSVFVVFYSLVTTLPLYTTGPLHRTDEEAGLLLTVFLISAIVVRPFSGKLLERFGKRRMLWVSIWIYSVCTFLYAFISGFEVLLILRLFHGIWFSIATTATGAIAADTIPKNRRGTGLGYFAMSTNLAVVVGPFLALTAVQQFSYDALFLLVSILVILSAVVALFIPQEPQKTQAISLRFTLNDLVEKAALPVAFIGGLLSFAHGSILSYLSIYAEQQNFFEFASYFFVVFAAVMLLSRPFTGRIFDLHGPYAILIPGFISYILGFVILAFASNGWIFLLAAAFTGFGYGALIPSLQTMAVQSTAHERSGYATATFFTLFDLGIAVGSAVLGVVAVTSSYKMVYLVSALLVISALFFMLIRMRKLTQLEKG